MKSIATYRVKMAPTCSKAELKFREGSQIIDIERDMGDVVFRVIEDPERLQVTRTFHLWGVIPKDVSGYTWLKTFHRGYTPSIEYLFEVSSGRE